MREIKRCIKILDILDKDKKIGERETNQKYYKKLYTGTNEKKYIQLMLIQT